MELELFLLSHLHLLSSHHIESSQNSWLNQFFLAVVLRLFTAKHPWLSRNEIYWHCDAGQQNIWHVGVKGSLFDLKYILLLLLSYVMSAVTSVEAYVKFQTKPNRHSSRHGAVDKNWELSKMISIVNDENNFLYPLLKKDHGIKSMYSCDSLLFADCVLECLDCDG